VIVESLYEIRTKEGVLPYVIWTSRCIYLRLGAERTFKTLTSGDFSDWHNNGMSKSLYKKRNQNSLAYETRRHDPETNTTFTRIAHIAFKQMSKRDGRRVDWSATNLIK